MEGLDVFPFGSLNRPRPNQCWKVACTVCSHFQSSGITLEALEVPEVCTVKGPFGNLHCNDASQPQLPLADENETEQLQTPIISVLLGSGHYWRLISNVLSTSMKTLAPLTQYLAGCFRNHKHEQMIFTSQAAA